MNIYMKAAIDYVEWQMLTEPLRLLGSTECSASPLAIYIRAVI